MKLNIHRLLTATGLLVATASAADDVPDTSIADLFERNLNVLLCRCEADWENFYYRRLLQEAGVEVQQGEHELDNGEDEQEPSRHRQLYHHYDYTQAYLDGGYYVIEDVKVLPSEQCSSFGFRGRSLEQTTMRASGQIDAFDLEVESSVAMFQSEENSDEQSPEARDLTYYYGGRHQGKQTVLQQSNFLLCS